MPTSAESTPAGRTFAWCRFVPVWLAVSAVVVSAHFSLSYRMGLYEDDHWLIGVPMCEWRNTGDLWSSVKSVFVQYFQGRPLCFAIGNGLTYLSTQIAGLTGAYVLAAGITSLNAGLCLALLWRRFGPVAATIAALVFVLLPADTTHSMLHAVLYVHPSVTFLLLSGVAYSRGRPALAVLLSAGTLLTYETCFLPALAWPILFPDPVRSLWRRGLTHGLAMGLVLALAVFVRVQVGESRATETFTDKRAVVRKVKELATTGPRAALATFRARPLATARAWKAGVAFGHPGPRRRTVVLASFGAGLAALVALALARRAARSGAAPPVLPGDASAPPPQVPEGVTGTEAVVRLLVGGAVMVVLGYVAALTREPQIVSGRMSSVHIASTLGWGVFFAGVITPVTWLLNRLRVGWAFAPAAAAYLGLLAGFHVGVQRDYVRAWIAQGEFWKDVVAECPDVKPGTIILYPLVTPKSEMVREQEWADHMVFAHLFAVPPEWGTPPRAFSVGHLTWGVPRDYDGYDWNEVEREGDQLYWKHWDGTRVRLEPGNVILLKLTPEGRFERVTGTVRMAGVDLPLKPRGEATFTFPPYKLYPAMFPNGHQLDAPKVRPGEGVAETRAAPARGDAK